MAAGFQGFLAAWKTDAFAHYTSDRSLSPTELAALAEALRGPACKATGLRLSCALNDADTALIGDALKGNAWLRTLELRGAQRGRWL
jgi:hypothetical protein